MNARRFIALVVPLAACGCGAGAPSTPRPPDAVLGPVTPAPASRPLAVGDPFPKLEADGWINGAAPDPVSAKLLVVDLWSQWCPFCARSAPGLNDLHAKYAPKGVAFVGLSNMSKGGAENFVRTHALGWPNGYGARSEHLAALGVRSGMPGPAEYELAPTMYLVSPAGRVVWCDDRGRFAHQDPNAWVRKVDLAIERALAAPEPKGTP